MRHKLPSSVFNWLSLAGAVIALITLFMIVFLFAISILFGQGGSYLGLVIYIILPAIMVAGLFLIPIGMYRQHRKEKREKLIGEKEWPRLDLNIVQHRNAFLIFIIGSTFLLFVSAIGSYEAFEYTESTSFCGELCHEVMNPEFTAYQNSSHERVACVECHVGSGVDWYVRSKLSGMRQIYKVFTNTFHRPIETPIRDLRPAQETCEHCHWPEKFYPQKLIEKQYFLEDEENSEWIIGLKMKVGPAKASQALAEGIHWHINPDVRVEYVASDFERQDIKWVRYTNLATGEETIYTNPDNELEEGELDTLEVRTMDCMDCHNRPSHVYNSPSVFINNALASGSLSKEIPEAKTFLKEYFSGDFETTEEMVNGLKESAEEYYTENYPEFIDENRERLDAGIEAILASAQQNIFPEMKVNWREYPQFIGHLEYLGCNRCHNDLFVSEKEKTISRDCVICHSITSQGPPDELEYASSNLSLDFKHPVDIEEAWREQLCSDCHSE